MIHPQKLLPPSKSLSSCTTITFSFTIGILLHHRIVLLHFSCVRWNPPSNYCKPQIPLQLHTWYLYKDICKIERWYTILFFPDMLHYDKSGMVAINTVMIGTLILVYLYNIQTMSCHVLIVFTGQGSLRTSQWSLHESIDARATLKPPSLSFGSIIEPW